VKLISEKLKRNPLTTLWPRSFKRTHRFLICKAHASVFWILMIRDTGTEETLKHSI
jgi:hypothetical protein